MTKCLACSLSRRTESPTVGLSGSDRYITLSWPPDFIDGVVGQGFTVARFDNRDVGLSTHLISVHPLRLGRVLVNHHAAPYRLEDMADDTLVGRRARWDRPNVAGCSIGGTIAQTLAIRQGCGP
jgi:pimeloyl-ACP methyl ester carboxylesterase